MDGAGAGIDRDDGRLGHDYALPPHEHERVRGPQIDRHVAAAAKAVHVGSMTIRVRP
jgi:hypothetical protein